LKTREHSLGCHIIKYVVPFPLRTLHVSQAGCARAPAQLSIQSEGRGKAWSPHPAIRDAPPSRPVLSNMLQAQPGKGAGIWVVRCECGISE